MENIRTARTINGSNHNQMWCWSEKYYVGNKNCGCATTLNSVDDILCPRKIYVAYLPTSCQQIIYTLISQWLAKIHEDSRAHHAFARITNLQREREIFFCRFALFLLLLSSLAGFMWIHMEYSKYFSKALLRFMQR